MDISNIMSNAMIGDRSHKVTDYVNGFAKDLLNVKIGDFKNFNMRNYAYMQRAMFININEYYRRVMVAGTGVPYRGDSENLNNEIDYFSYSDPINYTHYVRNNPVAERDGVNTTRVNRKGKKVNLYPDDNDLGSFNNKWNIEPAGFKQSLLGKTKKAFLNRQINTIISRFSTNGDPGSNGIENPNDARSPYGLSHGRNLLRKSAEDNPGENYLINGYNDPYCRVWTHHYQLDKLYKSMRPFTGIGENGEFNGEVVTSKELHNWGDAFKGENPDGYNWKTGMDKWDKSVLNKDTGLLNIAPTFNHNENIHTKQCMFSIENLAWKDYDPYSFEKALSWEQRGPNGGRIMWFPPYDLKINEATRVNWNSQSFIGRGENIYTYTNTERVGTLSFLMLVDHPSVVDYATWYDNKETTDNDLHRYFAGCDSADPNDPNSLLSKVRPTPLTDEYVDSGAVGNSLNGLKDDKEESPDEISEAIFYVFFPNNYSGCYDQIKHENVKYSSKKVDAISYLLSGYGAQKNILEENDKLFEDLITPNIDSYKNIGKGDKNLKRGYEIGDSPISIITPEDSPDTSQTETYKIYYSKEFISLQDNIEDDDVCFVRKVMTDNEIINEDYNVSDLDLCNGRLEALLDNNPKTYHYEKFVEFQSSDWTFDPKVKFEDHNYIFVDFDDVDVINDSSIETFTNVEYFSWNEDRKRYDMLTETDFKSPDGWETSGKFHDDFFDEIFTDKKEHENYKFIFYEEKDPDSVGPDPRLEADYYGQVADDEVYIDEEKTYSLRKKINDYEYEIIHIGLLEKEPLTILFTPDEEKNENKLIGQAVIREYEKKIGDTVIESIKVSSDYFETYDDSGNEEYINQQKDELRSIYDNSLKYYVIKDSWIPDDIVEETSDSITIEKKYYDIDEDDYVTINVKIYIGDYYCTNNDLNSDYLNRIETHYPDKSDSNWSSSKGTYVRNFKRSLYYRADGFYEYPKNEFDKYSNTWAQVLEQSDDKYKDSYYDTKSYHLNSDYKQIIGSDRLESEDNKNKVFSFTDVACALSHIYKWPKESIKYLEDIVNKNNSVDRVKLLEDKINGLDIKDIKITGVSNSHGIKSEFGKKRNEVLAKNRAETIKLWLQDMIKDVEVTCDIDSSHTVNNNEVSSLEAKLYRCVKCVIKFNKTETIDVSDLNNSNNSEEHKSDFVFAMERDGIKYYRKVSYGGNGSDLWYEKNGQMYKVSVINDEKEFSTETLDISELNAKKEKYNTIRYDQEYHFFKQVKNEHPDVWEKIIDKIKFFNPAFHSMTPEGFNARLNFLQQCTRQGNTVTMSDKNGATANNLAFGRPPFCILRLGDFYNQMIAINSIDFDYNVDNAPLWDMNHDGIGVQPLLCRVNMQVTFIGGGDLSGPVRRLQNANTFNYYANTSLYDNRADDPKYDFDNTSNIGTLDKNNSKAYITKLRTT